MILFLSRYPKIENDLKDGFFQRVVDIDTYFKNEERVYLDVSPFKFFTKEVYKDQDKNRVTYSCNLFLHLFIIIKLFKKANLVYIQSLYNVLYNTIFIKLIDNKYILDLHGVVPEELEFQGMKFKSKIFNFIENFLFNRFHTCIAVTNRLVGHYKEKYPNINCNYIVYTIFPKNLGKVDLNFLENETVNIIYSGNLQKWQNIELMLLSIKDNLHDNLEFTILTGNLKEMQNLLNQYGLSKEKKIHLKSVLPNQLEKYYLKSNYGFVLRDDITVNNVACPTKLIEYMYYGIIPIILSDNIGDFKECGYERIHYSRLGEKLKKIKSKKNNSIIKNMELMNKEAINKLLSLVK